MTDLPVLDLACLKCPSGRCVLVAESCVSCRNRDVLLAHAAAYDRELWSPRLPKENIRAESALGAVLALAGKKTMEELEGKT